MASGKDFETLHAMYKNITEQLQAIQRQTKKYFVLRLQILGHTRAATWSVLQIWREDTCFWVQRSETRLCLHHIHLVRLWHQLYWAYVHMVQKVKKCLSKTKTGMFSSGKRTTLTTMWCIEISWTRAQLQDWIEVSVPTQSGRTMCCRQGKSQKMRISEARASQWQEEGVATLSDHQQRYLGSPALCCLYLWACPWLLWTGDQASTRVATPWWTGGLSLCIFLHLCPSPRFGSIYEIEEKDDEKQQKEDRPCDEDDNDGRSTEEPSPENEHNVTCYLEDEVANAKSMCNLDMPQDPQAR